MVDLAGQYEKIKPEIDLAIQQVIDSSAFINGSVVQEFASDLEKYLDVKHVIPCGNGTDALQVAMMGLGLKPGDEIITTSFTFIATAEVIALLGLIPVFVDVDPNTFNIDTSAIIKAISSKTKAIVPVHLFGQCADMDRIMEIAKKNNLFVIEDTCQAIGADFLSETKKNLKAGTLGDVGCTSFFPSKNLGCYGDGGALFTNNDKLAETFRSIVNHGMKVRYHHNKIGVNSRLDSIQAAILKVKLPNLNEYSDARKKAAKYYDDAFRNNSKLKIPVRFPKSKHVFHQYTLQLIGINRNYLIEYLKSKNIPAMVYYPIPIHLQEAYRNLDYKKGDLPVTEALCKTVFSLPMHTELNIEQLKFISNSVLEFVNNN